MTLLTYLIQATSCLALLYAFFHLVLQKETTFQSNRWYLISSLVISSILPFVKIYIDEQLARSIVTAPTVFVGQYMDTFEKAVAVSASDDRLNWSEIFFRIYVAGIVMFGFRFFSEIFKIQTIKRGGNKIVLHNHPCIFSDKVKSPFSFFNTVFLPVDHGF